MNDASFENITSAVKLVIWDLDETFWKGTLSEGGIETVQAHIDMVRTLVDRGIMCAICSKNDFEEARKALQELGIWDAFVFPHIQWSPKGQAIAAMIHTMGLRDENVLFLDDNHLNLEEAQFFNKSLMVVDGTGNLPALLDLPELKGKDDSKQSRLAQYKLMENKQSEQTKAGLSNVEFLKQSDIKINIITDIDKHMDRAIELLNRTNQLNFTKIRTNTDEERKTFEDLLNLPGAHAGLIQASDRYGDYGIIGFFLLIKRSSGTRLEHFAFSCRTLNMGIEQYIYDLFEKPDIRIVEPVANGLDVFDEVNWIAESYEAGGVSSEIDRQLCLVGGCDLLQMSFYCGKNRDEYVNIVRNGTVVRYDDVGFFLNDRNDASINNFTKRLEMWTRAEMQAFDKSITAADVVLLSLYQSAAGQHFFTFGGTEFGGKHLVHTPAQALRGVLKSDNAVWFAKHFYHRPYSLPKKLDLIEKAYNRVLDLANETTKIILIGASEQGELASRSTPIREGFNALNRRFENTHENVIFMDIDAIMQPEDIVSSDHYTRNGYFKMAQFVNGILSADLEVP